MAKLDSGNVWKFERPRLLGRRPEPNARPEAQAATVLGQIEACVPALRRYATALLRDREEADDLVRECLIRALDTLHARRGDAPVKVWLFMNMHNLFMIRMRRRRFRVASKPAALMDELERSQSRPGEDELPGCDLLRGLDDLPHEQRSLLLLVTVEGLTYAEAAEALGVPAGMVLSTLAQGRERLRQFTNTLGHPLQGRGKWAATPAA